MIERDKVSYHFGYKWQLEPYRMADVSILYETQIRDGETEEDAYKRARQFVDAKVKEKVKDVIEKQKSQQHRTCSPGTEEDVR